MALHQSDLQRGAVLLEPSSKRLVTLLYPSFQHGNSIPGWNWIDQSDTRGWTMVPTLLGEFRELTKEELQAFQDLKGTVEG